MLLATDWLISPLLLKATDILTRKYTMPSAIEDYGFIGDCHTGALIGCDGSIDWLCLPRFDSAACFAALLGTPEHGRWQIAPATENVCSHRSYQEDTMVLETEFETPDGVACTIDFMPPRSGTVDLIRIVEGRRGTVAMKSHFAPRFDYGAVVPWMRRSHHMATAVGGPDLLSLYTAEPLQIDHDAAVSEFTVSAGQRKAFTMVWQRSEKTELLLPHDPERALDATQQWWREWIGRCNYRGEWSRQVRRSLLTLKSLIYAPSGGIVAAATTSLPVRLGGDRNWDYRFCWLRDATFTLIALLNAGYRQEAEAWREWLLRAVAGRPAQMSIMYGLHGERRLTEIELPWLPGYEGAKPVRIGNAAHAQHQLDIYGEVMDVFWSSLKAGIQPGQDEWRIERAVLSFLESSWHEPDDGIWELRIPSRHYTHSKLMAWVAFDRAVKLAASHGLEGDVNRWRSLRDEIHEQICCEGFNSEVGAFVQWYGSDRLDAALLMLPLVGFLPVEDPRVAGTIAAIERDLMHDGFVVRYPPVAEAPTRSPGESAFLLCSYWLVDCWQLQGREAEARQLFEKLLSLTNDVGLQSEGYDTKKRRFTGNYPQAFSHVGLINSAYSLSRKAAPDQRAES
jgi:GH15 family glucan-1,4-alpha-glucosidase